MRRSTKDVSPPGVRSSVGAPVQTEDGGCDLGTVDGAVGQLKGGLVMRKSSLGDR